MRLPTDIDELHVIAEYYTACRTMRRMGWGGIVFGIVNIGLGIGFAVYLHPINAILAIIGALLLGSGIWCLVLPGAEGAITNGISLILVGLWNILVTILNMAATADAPGHTPQVWWAIFGVALIVGGIQCFQKYSRFSRALRNRASPDEMELMDKLVKKILKAKVKDNEDMIAFQVSAFMQQKHWIGRLRDNIAYFVDKWSKEVIVVKKRDVSIKTTGKVALGKTLKATVRIGEHEWKALISPESFDNYRDWKFAKDEHEDHRGRADEDDADEDEPQTGIRGRDDDERPRTNIKRRRPRPEEDE